MMMDTVRVRATREVTDGGCKGFSLQSLLDGVLGEEAELEQLICDAQKSRKELKGLMSSPLRELENAMVDLKPMLTGAVKLGHRISETRELADALGGRVRRIDSLRSRGIEALDRVKQLLKLRTCIVGVQRSIENDELETASLLVQEYESEYGLNDTGHLIGNEQGISVEEAKQDVVSLASRNIRKGLEVKNDDIVFHNCRILSRLGHGKEGITEIIRSRCALLRDTILADLEKTLEVNKLHSLDDSLYPIDSEPGKPRSERTLLTSLAFAINKIVDTMQTISHSTKKCVKDDIELLYLIAKSFHAAGSSLLEEILKKILETKQLEERVRVLVNNPADLVGAIALDSESLRVRATADISFTLFKIDALLNFLALCLKHIATYTHFIRSHVFNLDPSRDFQLEDSEYLVVVREISGCYAIIEKAYFVAAMSTAAENEVCQHVPSTNFSFLAPDAPGIRIENESVYTFSDTDQVGKEVTISSIAEDSFYIVDKILDRSRATYHVNNLCSMIEAAVKGLDDVVLTVMRKRLTIYKGKDSNLGSQSVRKLDEFRQAAILQATQALARSGTVSSSSTNRNFPGELDLEAQEFDKGSSLQSGIGDESHQRVLESIECTLNTLSICRDNIGKVIRKLETFSAQEVWLQSERMKLLDYLSELCQSQELFNSLHKIGISILVSKLAPSLQDNLDNILGQSNVNFDITGEEFAGFNAGKDTYVLQLLQAIDCDINTSIVSLDFANMEAAIFAIAVFVAKGVELIIVRKRFTQFGALLLDRQVREIRRYFAARINSMENPFSRLQRIVSLLNLDNVEDVHDVYSAETCPELSKTEVKGVLTLRIDFRLEYIQRLRL